MYVSMQMSLPKSNLAPVVRGTGGNWDDMTHGAGDASWDAPAGAGGEHRATSQCIAVIWEVYNDASYNHILHIMWIFMSFHRFRWVWQNLARMMIIMH